jgi:hypothetical protein
MSKQVRKIGAVPQLSDSRRVKRKMMTGLLEILGALFVISMIYVFPFAFFFFLTCTVALRDRDTKLKIGEIAKCLVKKLF